MASGNAKPKTYIGYDKDNKVVTKKTAEDADNYINMGDVDAKIKDISGAMADGVESISAKLSKYSTDSDDALIVDGANMKKPIEDLVGSIQTLPSAVEGDLSEVRAEVAKAHDAKQEELNNEAYSAVKNTSGVISVNGG